MGIHWIVEFYIFAEWGMENSSTRTFQAHISCEEYFFSESTRQAYGEMLCSFQQARSAVWRFYVVSTFNKQIHCCSKNSCEDWEIRNEQSIFIAVLCIPFNIQRRNEQSIEEGSWLFKYSLEHAEREWTFYNRKVRRAFFALFLQKFFSKFWISRHFYDLLGKYWWCYSKQKNAPVHF